jgi:hypothetical protein
MTTPMGHDTPEITDAGDSQRTNERIQYVIRVAAAHRL